MIKKTIYYHDTDAGGVVYYANYLKFMEEARVEFFHEKGFSENSAGGRPVFFPVHRCDIVYHQPVRHGDTVLCTARVKDITPAKIVFQQTVLHHAAKTLLVEAEVTLACVSASDFKLMRIPEDIRQAFRPDAG